MAQEYLAWDLINLEQRTALRTTYRKKRIAR